MEDQLQQEFTEGQKLLGLDSNPTNVKGTDDYIYDVKLKFGEIADMLLRRREDKGNSYGKNLLIGGALTALIAACSAVVKVISYRH